MKRTSLTLGFWLLALSPTFGQAKDAKAFRDDLLAAQKKLVQDYATWEEDLIRILRAKVKSSDPAERYWSTVYQRVLESATKRSLAARLGKLGQIVEKARFPNPADTADVLYETKFLLPPFKDLQRLLSRAMQVRLTIEAENWLAIHTAMAKQIKAQEDAADLLRDEKATWADKQKAFAHAAKLADDVGAKLDAARGTPSKEKSGGLHKAAKHWHIARSLQQKLQKELDQKPKQVFPAYVTHELQRSYDLLQEHIDRLQLQEKWLRGKEWHSLCEELLVEQAVIIKDTREVAKSLAADRPLANFEKQAVLRLHDRADRQLPAKINELREHMDGPTSLVALGDWVSELRRRTRFAATKLNLDPKVELDLKAALDAQEELVPHYRKTSTFAAEYLNLIADVEKNIPPEPKELAALRDRMAKILQSVQTAYDRLDWFYLHVSLAPFRGLQSKPNK